MTWALAWSLGRRWWRELALAAAVLLLVAACRNRDDRIRQGAAQQATQRLQLARADSVIAQRDVALRAQQEQTRRAALALDTANHDFLQQLAAAHVVTRVRVDGTLELASTPGSIGDGPVSGTGTAAAPGGVVPIPSVVTSAIALYNSCTLFRTQCELERQRAAERLASCEQRSALLVAPAPVTVGARRRDQLLTFLLGAVTGAAADRLSHRSSP
ncbi:MAG: hypothetical protein JWO05_1140 [Gemmatimonadetes bacterium]|nr:hypothetical protein [Gemmatimonadota bacterium]